MVLSRSFILFLSLFDFAISRIKKLSAGRSNMSIDFKAMAIRKHAPAVIEVADMI